MILKPHVFADKYVPEELWHRDRELAQVLRVLSPVVQGQSSRTLLISGPAGSGKTALVQTAFAGKNADAAVPSAVVSVRGQATPEILRQLLSQHPEADSEAGTQSQAALADQLDEVISAPYTVVLDDAGTHHTQEVLAVLQAVGPIGIVVVGRTHDSWLSAHPHEHHEDGIEHHVRCRAYTRSELADILEQRAVRGVELGCWSRPTLERIAARADGNAACAIRLFKMTLRLAAQRDHETVRRVDIADATIEVSESTAPH